MQVCHALKIQVLWLQVEDFDAGLILIRAVLSDSLLNVWMQ